MVWWADGCLEGIGPELLTELGGVVDDQVVGGCLPGGGWTGEADGRWLFAWVGGRVNGRAVSG